MANNRTKPVETSDNQLAAEIPKLKAFLQRLAPEEGEDLLHDVVERALRYRHAFEPEGSLYGWLKKTAFRAFLDHRLKRGQAPGLLGDRVSEIQAPSRSEIENRELVAKLIEGLGSKERDVLVRFHCYDESISDIASALNKPEGTVKSLLHRARRKLAESREKDA